MHTHDPYSQQEYDAALSRPAARSSSGTTAAAAVHHDDQNASSHDDAQDGGGGITIGTYRNCTHVAQGVTSTVYRSGTHALKVIVAHRNLEPHDPQREASILSELHSMRPPPEHIIRLIETFRDRQQQFVLVFPHLPLTLETVLARSASSPSSSLAAAEPLETVQVQCIFRDILRGLAAIHAQGIIHRDIKPSAILLASPTGPAYVADFGTAWHPRLSSAAEPPSGKVLDIGTGAYRAPEVLFANKAYGTPVDMWAVGVMLAEAVTAPPKPPFESRPAHEDGSQLGLILSVFRTLGTPTRATWPEAQQFKVSPFELWTVFPQRSWQVILPNVDAGFRHLVGDLVRFESASRASAAEVRYAHCWCLRQLTDLLIPSHRRCGIPALRVMTQTSLQVRAEPLSPRTWQQIQTSI